MTTENQTTEQRGLELIGFDAGTPKHDGNIAAHLWRYVYGNGEGLTGIALGWKDMQASTDFLAGIFHSVVEAIDYGRDDEAVHEIADGAVPVYTAELIDAASQLGLTDQAPELVAEGGTTTIATLATALLYESAYEIAGALWYGLTSTDDAS